ncbi:hypothetical protein [Mycobacterium intracellulare]|nr:hypothetical protein [Mycobacterium intracellulare]
MSNLIERLQLAVAIATLVVRVWELTRARKRTKPGKHRKPVH